MHLRILGSGLRRPLGLLSWTSGKMPDSQRRRTKNVLGRARTTSDLERLPSPLLPRRLPARGNGSVVRTGSIDQLVPELLVDLDSDRRDAGDIYWGSGTLLGDGDGQEMAAAANGVLRGQLQLHGLISLLLCEKKGLLVGVWFYFSLFCSLDLFHLQMRA